MNLVNRSAKNENTSSVRWALASLSLSMLLSSVGISIANVALPTLANVFVASFQEVQWIILSYLLATTLLIVGVGRLGDIMGRKRVLLAGICIYTVAAFFCGIAPTLWALIGARALQGLGAAILMAQTVASVGETVSKAKTGSAMGLLGTMSAIGTAAGPALGGFLISGLGWRAIFLIMVPIGLLNLFLAYRYLPASKQTSKKDQMKFDKIGMALLSAEKSANLFMNALVAAVVMSTLVVGPFYLSRALGLDATQVGIIMSISPIISILSGVPAGRLVDRWGERFVLIVGLVGMAIGAISMATLPSLLGVAGYIVSAIVMSPGYQMFQAANNTLIMADVSSAQRGVVSGMLSLSRNLGLIIGTSVMGAVFAFGSGTSSITSASPEAVSAGMRFTFVIAVALILVALVLAHKAGATKGD